ncbi:MAG: hypothetical protein JW982_07560 [Spirochaetes bacterium]|nr:hypothetical protein [Spirochaetota bacterium]
MIAFLPVILLYAGFISAVLIAASKQRQSLKNQLCVELASEYNLEYNSFRSYPDVQLSGLLYEHRIALSVKLMPDIFTIRIEFEFSNDEFRNIYVAKSTSTNGIFANKNLVIGRQRFDSMFITTADSEISAIALMNDKISSAFAYLYDNVENLILDEKGIKINLTSGKEYVKREIRKMFSLLKEIADEIEKAVTLQQRFSGNILNSSRETMKISNFYALLMLDPENKPAENLFSEIFKCENNICSFNFDIDQMKSEIRIRALKIIEILKLSGFEKYLIQLITDKDDKLIDNVFSALSAAGTISSVEPLMKISSDSINPFFKQKCHETIAAIQSRLGNAGKGWVSVSSSVEMEGALSRDASPEKGMLSIDDAGKTKEKNN